MVRSDTEVDPRLGWIWHPLLHLKNPKPLRGDGRVRGTRRTRAETAAEGSQRNASREEGRDY